MDIGIVAGNHESLSPRQYQPLAWREPAIPSTTHCCSRPPSKGHRGARTGKLATFLGKPWTDEGWRRIPLHFSVVDASGPTHLMA
jgi:glutamine synthetase